MKNLHRRNPDLLLTVLIVGAIGLSNSSLTLAQEPEPSPPKLTAQTLVNELMSGERSLADHIDPERGVLFVRYTEGGPSRYSDPAVESHELLCGVQLTAEIPSLLRRLYRAMNEEDEFRCRTTRCSYACYEWSPCYYFHFAADPVRRLVLHGVDYVSDDGTLSQAWSDGMKAYLELARADGAVGCGERATPTSAMIVVAAAQTEVTIVVDGTPREARRVRSELRAEIEPGAHHLEVRRDAHRSFETDLELVAGEVRRFKVDLVPNPVTLIPSGQFSMGPHLEDEDQFDYFDDIDITELQHPVTISRPFLMATRQVSRAQWAEVMRSHPTCDSECDGDCPVSCVNWWEALAFSNALSIAEGFEQCYELVGCTGALGYGRGGSSDADDYECEAVVFRGLECTGYRLPTEAEWEYAARAGGDQPLRPELPNAWNLYDLIDDIGEWCWDWRGEYPSNPVTDPLGPETGETRVTRGDYSAGERGRMEPAGRYEDVGFRVVRTENGSPLPAGDATSSDESSD